MNSRKMRSRKSYSEACCTMETSSETYIIVIVRVSVLTNSTEEILYEGLNTINIGKKKC